MPIPYRVILPTESLAHPREISGNLPEACKETAKNSTRVPLFSIYTIYIPLNRCRICATISVFHLGRGREI